MASLPYPLDPGIVVNASLKSAHLEYAVRFVPHEMVPSRRRIQADGLMSSVLCIYPRYVLGM